ncbi:hypothetical protein DM01DRAFT_1336811 [Hesseltinella vesiculosa]|uniref:Amine oxidase n=1 Tax=Hesseltinella vesiculosa TaxID=101127 RepID=A0A1X2GFA4_9FUNG|nr:hypothetical protein DM01DRAFT_1336811 [Hesseltinella vesiculosa]
MVQSLHPLTPLSPQEIKQASAVVSDARKTDPTFYNFVVVTLVDPPKDKVLAQIGWIDAEPLALERQAFVMLRDRPSGLAHEIVVSLKTNQIVSWKKVEGVQPSIHVSEALIGEKIMRKDPRVIAEVAKHGITDMSKIYIDSWPVGYHKTIKGRRLMQGLVYYRKHENSNQYAHPLDFFPIYDPNTEEVVDIDFGVPRNSKFDRAQVPFEENEYFPENVGQDNVRKDVKPLKVEQPEGVSFTVKNSREIEWQKWRFHIGFNYREGVVLQTVSYQDGDQERPILYELAGAADMIVPYCNPYSPYNRKMALDHGEMLLATMSNSQKSDCSCLGHIYYIDAVVVDEHGQPATIPNAICIHEEDAGLLHKHTDFRTNIAHASRSRRLVISQFATAANYDYGFYYYLYQDGSIQFEVKATGELNTHVLAEDEDPRPYGTIVSKNVVGQHHQHLFMARCDAMIDGLDNTVTQVDIVPSPLPMGHPDNELGNVFYPEHTVLEDTEQAKTSVDSSKGRSWLITNENKKHPFTLESVAYRLSTNTAPTMLAQPGSVVATRGAFARHNLWVTPYHPDQRFASGLYCNQTEEETGLPLYTKEKLPIRNKDIVLWLCYGLNHFVRVEDL